VVIALLFTVLTTIGVPSTPAYADTTIDGCTIVAHPNATRFTDCPGVDLSGATLAGVNLSYANLSGTTLWGTNLDSANLHHADLSKATLATCYWQLFEPPPESPTCPVASFTGASLIDANLTDAATSECGEIGPPYEATEVSACAGGTMSDANLTGANLAGDDLSWVVLSHAKLLGASFPNVTFGECSELASQPCGGADLTGANLRGIDLSGAALTRV